MENSKAKSLIIVVLIILLLACLGVVIWQYIKLNSTTSNQGDIMGEINTPTQQDNVSNNHEENKEDIAEKKQYNKVSDLIEDLVYKNNPIEKKIDNVKYKLDMVLPYFKLKTDVTEKINKEIYNIYTFNSEDYLSKEVTQSSSRNKTISYKANMDTEKGVLTLEITIAYTDWAGTGVPNGSSTTTYKYDYINDKLLEKEEQETNNVEKEQNKIDPYANYKDYEWGSTKLGNKKEAYLEIKNNKVYVTYSNKTTQVKNIIGTPIKAIYTVRGGAICFEVLTKEGKVYSIIDWETTANLDANLSKHDVIDITVGRGKGIVDKVFYCLTADGKLIDQNGDTFEELNKNFVYSFGSLGHVVYIGSDNYVYFSKNRDANYTIIKDTNGNKVKAKELYMHDSNDGEVIIIITQDNQIVYVRNDGKITQEKGKLKSVNTYAEDRQGMMLVTMDTNKNIIKYNVWDSYYNVVKAEALEMKQETAIESIQMYKRKEGTSEYYQNSMNLTKEQIGRVREVLSEMKQAGDASSLNNETYKVVIKFKSGIEVVLKVYPSDGVVMDDVLYTLEGQMIETFGSIQYKYSWK